MEGIAESIEKLTGEKKAERTIEEYIQIAKELPKKVKEKIRTGSSFGLRHALQFLRLKDKPREQLKLAEKFAKKAMTVQKLRQEVDKILKPQKRLTLSDFLKKINPIFYEFSIWEVPAKRPEGGMVDYKVYVYVNV